MNRKQRRAMAKAAKKQAGLESEIADKLMMFDHLPDECSACVKPFDKKDREMVFSWNVVVRKKEKKVNLYCPECWTKAKDIIEEFARRQDDN